MPHTLECIGLNVAVNGRNLVQDLGIALSPGEFVCMLGPNGVGKTLTLHTLAGLRPAQSGTIRLNGEALEKLDRSVIAQRLGLLLQNPDDAFPTTVFETALMGRHSRLGFWQWESERDLNITRAALAAMDLTMFEHRKSATLSGGERRRLALAMLLVQNPDVLLLDEPMNHLDPLHKLTVLDRLTSLAREGKTVLASLHDPATAGRYASAVLLLYGDGHWQYGPTDELLTPETMERLYRTPFARFTRDEQSVLLPAT
jgi:iron complex transport system ATP-binding protein